MKITKHFLFGQSKPTYFLDIKTKDGSWKNYASSDNLNHLLEIKQALLSLK